MKFGEYIAANREPGWEESYIDYWKLKGIISELESSLFSLNVNDSTGNVTTSLSVGRPTDAAGMPIEIAEKANDVSQETFYNILEGEMRKIELFTKKQVQQIRKDLQDVNSNISKVPRELLQSDPELNANLTATVESIGETFLKLEKYVNLNVTGFHKILKKHDRRLPNPCKAFYILRLHDQSWVRGDYSDVLVSMSKAYTSLRGDAEVEAKETERQDFVRSTRKYWVHMEDISRVKYIILQHLPVFMQKTMGEQDSQLVNSVYLDNYSLELYQGRLDKTPGAIALRFRWYGTGTPEIVFVERKTHREAWTGEVSVKERFIIKEDQVPSLLAGTFNIDAEVSRMKQKGKSSEEINEWKELAVEVIQAINSKQLTPTLRTQYMRTAFQIPFDATVRVSLDTNLCMIFERTKEVVSGARWFRDPHNKIPSNEITRFPHAVLEIKLQLEDESKTPTWVEDLIVSGMLMEVHKFSKFIHGCSVLLSDEVRAAPYWIDDVTLRPSIEQSGATPLLKNRVGANEVYNHLLPHDDKGMVKAKRIAAMTAAIHPDILPPDIPAGETCSAQWYTDISCCEGEPYQGKHVVSQREEPKSFFANERTFIKWLEMAVLMSGISIGVLAFSSKKSKSTGFALCMLVMAELFIGYALYTFLWRNEKIKTRYSGRWDDPWGPPILCMCLIAALLVRAVLLATQ